LEAKLYFTIDKIACTLADRILLDTNSHISYFIDTFKLPRAKFYRIWVGADTDIMHPHPEIQENDEFTIFFYGSFIPLHGIEYIIEAAKILEEQKQQVKFILVGTGQTYKSMHKKAENLRIRTIKFIGRVPYEDLPLIMAKSHICLGIFGTTSKAQRVIPNKVFDALAASKPTITADTPAIKECLLHGKNIWLCPAGNPVAIAEAIITLKNNNCLRRNIGRNGYLRFKEIGSVDIIANQISLLIKEILNREKK
jgi:glycosyltransferase involved in cell wall biosynthesis